MNIMVKLIRGNKIRIVLVLFSLSTLTLSLHAQSCSCTNNLDSLISSIENNYVGFEHKVNGLKKAKYQILKDSLRYAAIQAENYSCYLLLKSYLSYFNDPHLSIFIVTAGIPKSFLDTLSNIFQQFPRDTVNEKKLRSYFSTNEIDKIEGIWQALGSEYLIAIYKKSGTDHQYVGLTLRGNNITWFPGQIKVEIKKEFDDYKAIFYRADHTAQNVPCVVYQDKLIFSGNGIYKKVFPQITQKADDNPVVGFQKISKNCNLLYLRDSWISNKKTLDSIVTSNLGELKTTKNLIIDLRNNGGGHIMTFDTILPLLYTGPIKRDGFIVKSSYDNILIYKNGLTDSAYSPNDIMAFKSIINKMENNINTLVKINSGDTLENYNILSLPSKIAIMVNKGTGSASELFLLWAKQSKKVKIIGENTKGALDYTEIGDIRNLPCPYVKFYCPMGMNEHKIYPYIDNIGIKPDIDLTKHQGNWIDFVRDYIEKND